MAAALACVSRAASATVLKTGDIVVQRAALARGDAGDDFGAVGNHLARVEAAFAAGETLHDDASLFVDQNAHRAPPARRTAFSAPSFISSANGEVESGIAQNLAALLDVGALHAHDDRKLQLQLARGGHHARGEHVAAQDAAENVDEDAAHLLVAGQNLERVFHLVGGSAAAHVEEVRRRAAGELDDIHGGHGQARAIDHAADRAIELDVVELVIRSFHLERVFLVEVAQFGRSLWR